MPKQAFFMPKDAIMTEDKRDYAINICKSLLGKLEGNGLRNISVSQKALILPQGAKDGWQIYAPNGTTTITITFLDGTVAEAK